MEVRGGLDLSKRPYPNIKLAKALKAIEQEAGVGVESRPVTLARQPAHRGEGMGLVFEGVA